MKRWEEQDTKFIQLNQYCEKSCYYTRRMGNDYPEEKTYLSHVFVCIFSNGQELVRNWENINYTVALKVQSKQKSMIEKSNYYICLFLKDKISMIDKGRIEGDSFCAKKYVFDSMGEGDIDYVEILENRIFHISLSEETMKAPKFAMVQLRNFRAYEGDFSIDLKNEIGKPYSFVLIYAKNGFGKTSLFDGIEYALRGAVARIEVIRDLNKKGNIEGAIYHNINHANEDAYSRIVLGDGRIIERPVSKVGENGNDCKIRPASKGKEIVGTSKDQDQWNRILLPHDKIDSFISARTPTAQYDEWMKSAPELQKEQEEFIKAHKVWREKEREVTKLKDSCEKKETEMRTLKQSETVLEKVEQFKAEYNQLAADDESIVLNIKLSDENSYIEFKNQIDRLVRRIETDKIFVLNQNLSTAKKILEGEIRSNRELCIQLEGAKKKKCSNEDTIKKKQSYDMAQKQMEIINLKLPELQRAKEPFVGIREYGVEKVYEASERLKKIEANMTALKDTVEYFDSELLKKRDEIRKLQEEIGQKKEKVLDSKEQEEAKRNINDIIIIDKKISEIVLKCTGLTDSNNNLMEEYKKSSHLLNMIESLEIPKEINDAEIKKVLDINALIPSINHEKIADFENQLASVQIELKKC